LRKAALRDRAKKICSRPELKNARSGLIAPRGPFFDENAEQIFCRRSQLEVSATGTN